ncbi:hypothetical protein DFH09DRAFT_1076612 [Mycena vulgaris]|nr:hypothetical protein DFH09DRAFT_1076612 [Mycena vulgaris]
MIDSSQAATATNDSDMGMSALWVVQTALELTREQLIQERAARKTLEKARGSACASSIPALIRLNTGRSANHSELQPARRRSSTRLLPNACRSRLLSEIKATAEARENELRAATQELEHRKTVPCVVMELIPTQDLHTMRARLEPRGRELGSARGELAITHAPICEHEKALKTTRRHLRAAQWHAVTLDCGHTQIRMQGLAKLRMRHKITSTSQRAATQRLRGRHHALQTAHAELQFTCRQLIELVEGLEAAGGGVDDAYERQALGRLHKKYQKEKQEKRALRAELVQLRATKENGVTLEDSSSRPVKRKSEGEIEIGRGGHQKRRMESMIRNAANALAPSRRTGTCITRLFPDPHPYPHPPASHPHPETAGASRSSTKTCTNTAPYRGRWGGQTARGTHQRCASWGAGVSSNWTVAMKRLGQAARERYTCSRSCGDALMSSWKKIVDDATDGEGSSSDEEPGGEPVVAMPKTPRATASMPARSATRGELVCGREGGTGMRCLSSSKEKDVSFVVLSLIIDPIATKAVFWLEEGKGQKKARFSIRAQGVIDHFFSSFPPLVLHALLEDVPKSESFSDTQTPRRLEYMGRGGRHKDLNTWDEGVRVWSTAADVSTPLSASNSQCLPINPVPSLPKVQLTRGERSGDILKFNRPPRFR